MTTINRTLDRETVTVWLCIDCLVMLANGEESPDADREPLSEIGEDDEITLGLFLEEHASDCAAREQGAECDQECDHDHFSSDPCEGCGSRLAGERHAATLWFTD
jgi:ribosomal protein L37AE/L43A